MSKQYPGGLITKTPPTPSGPYETSTAAGIWTLNQVAYWTKQGLWPTPGNIAPDPYFNYVTMLLHGNGSASGTTNVLPFNSDASTNAFNVTINGDTRSDNFNPFQEGYYSNYFDGTGDYLTAAANNAFVFGTGDFTVEAWIFAPSYPTDAFVISNLSTGNTSWSIEVYGGNIRFTGWTTIWLTATQPSLNAWHHVAVSRSGTTLSMYVDGIRVATDTNSTNFSANNTLVVGDYIPAGGANYIGYISNVRLVKGTAVYTGASFTVPTTPLTAISGTSLLTCQSNRFIDNSINAFTITKNGDTAVAPAQPFTLPSSVATYGSGYFDGTGDRLSSPANTALDLSTADFTTECWVYQTSFSITRAIFVYQNGDAQNSNYGYWLYVKTNGAVRFENMSGNSQVGFDSSVAINLNCWNHIAVTRTGTSATTYVNGVGTTGTVSATFNAPSGAILNIGDNFGSSFGSSNPYFGYITNLRIVKGTRVYTSNFTPPTAPLTAISGTSLLTTQYNGAGNNNGFKDSSQNNFTITRNGNTTQGTFSPYGSNWSNYFNGSSTYLSTASNSALAVGTGAFTAEAWIYPNTINNYAQVIGQNVSSNSYWMFVLQSNGAIRQQNYFNIQITSSAGAIVVGQWQHVVLVRDASSNIAIFVNGTRVASGTDSTNWSTNSVNNIGADIPDAGYFNGYISNVRVVKGTAVYDPTASTLTVPTTPLTAITNTSLLTAQSNRFIDNSASALVITPNGSPSVQRFSPFAPTSVYSTSTIGGSGYFDGSGDYLKTPTSGQFAPTGNFTVSFWYYPTTLNTYNTVIGNYTSTASTDWFIEFTSNGSVNVYTNGGTVRITGGAGTIKAGQWSFVTLSRSGTTITFKVNGTSIGTYTQSGTFGSASKTIFIGQYFNGSEYITGYLSDVRLIDGSEVTTIPTSPLTAVSGTNLLLNFTNAAIYDNSMMNDLETVGNAMVSTSVEKYGAGSMYFDGSSDGLIYRASPLMAFGTGNFTIEFWVYPNANQSNFTKYFTTGNSSGNLVIGQQSTANQICIDNNASVILSSSSNLSNTTWTHVAVVRSGTTLTIYFNGTSVGSTSNSTNWGAGTGSVGCNNAGAQSFNGYIDDLRVTKGVARYTANFTPPTSQFQDQ